MLDFLTCPLRCSTNTRIPFAIFCYLSAMAACAAFQTCLDDLSFGAQKLDKLLDGVIRITVEHATLRTRRRWHHLFDHHLRVPGTDTACDTKCIGILNGDFFATGCHHPFDGWIAGLIETLLCCEQRRQSSFDS